MNSPWPDTRRSIYSMDGSNSHPDVRCHIEHLGILSFGNSFLANEYKRSGDIIVDHLLQGKQMYQPDGLFMPVAYLYKHSLELKLKSLLNVAFKCGFFEESELSEERYKELLSRHRIIDIWSAIKPKIIEQFPQSPRKPVNNAEALIVDFHKLDNSGQSLRYPVTQSGGDVRKYFPDIVGLDLLKEAVDETYALIDVCDGYFSDIFDHMNDPCNY